MTGKAESSNPARLGLPAFGMGCAPIGDLYTRLTDEQASATLRASLDAGIRFFDTAPRYGAGLSERRLGMALREVRRSDVVVATKAGWLIDGTGAARPDFSAAGIRRSIEASLTRLGLDRVDLVHVHDPDNYLHEAVTDAIPALIKLRAEGIINGVGVGMNDSTLLARLVRDTGIDVALIAGRYTLLEQPALTDLLPACAEAGVAVIAAGVFNSGLLADPRPGAPYNYRPVPDDVLARAQRLRAVCAAYGVSLKAAALQFPVAHPAVTSVVIGAATPQEITENARLYQTDISAELWPALAAEGLLDPNAPRPSSSPAWRPGPAVLP
jgi:D-threo-aldose 1-dehydrogenase